MDNEQEDVKRDPPAAENAHDEAHFERIIRHLRVDAGTSDAALSPLAEGEALGIWISRSPDCPFDLWFDAVDEVWGAVAYSLLERVDDLVVWAECPSSENDASVVAKAIIDAVKDFRWKHQYKKDEGGWYRESPIRCEGLNCPHIRR